VAGLSRLMGFQPPLVRSLVINNINGYGINSTSIKLLQVPSLLEAWYSFQVGCVFDKEIGDRDHYAG
jgi:hypothetical protein